MGPVGDRPGPNWSELKRKREVIETVTLPHSLCSPTLTLAWRSPSLTALCSLPPKRPPRVAVYIPESDPLPTPPQTPYYCIIWDSCSIIGKTLCRAPPLGNPSPPCSDWNLHSEKLLDASCLMPHVVAAFPPLRPRTLEPVGGVGVYLLLIVASRPLFLLPALKCRLWSSRHQALPPATASHCSRLQTPRPLPAFQGDLSSWWTASFPMSSPASSSWWFPHPLT